MPTPEQERHKRTLELTPREVQLLLKYGYPFPDPEQALRESRAIGGIHRVRIDDYWIEHLVADLSRSARKIRSRSLLEEIDALCDTLEYAMDERPTPYVGDFD
jgi:succinate dehydrogenase/fumarate reductase flavoprotein subunit